MSVLAVVLRPSTENSPPSPLLPRYGFVIPNVFMVVLIFFTYSVIAPLLAPCCMAFFALGYLVFKYELIFSVTPKFESGGELWPMMVDFTLSAMSAGNFLVLCYIGIAKLAFREGVALIPLIVMNEMYRSYVRRAYKATSSVLAREEAVDADVALLTDAFLAHQHFESFDAELYKQPVLTSRRAAAELYRAAGPAARRWGSERDRAAVGRSRSWGSAQAREGSVGDADERASSLANPLLDEQADDVEAGRGRESGERF